MKNFEPHYAILSIIMLFPLPYVHIFSSALRSHTPSICVLHLDWQTRSLTHMKQHIKLCLFIF